MKKQFTKLVRFGLLSGVLLFLMAFSEAKAQQTVNGIVVDQSGIGIPGANVIVKGSPKGAITNFDGKFTINASSNDVLEISFIGYKTQSITVGSQSSITVTLIEDAAELDQVVVIGYGTAKKSDLTGSVSQVSSKSFERQPLTRVEDALQGRASGVAVSRAGGAPGSAVKVRIRGVNSINGDNSPLVVVDGIIGGDLSTINPNDISSMEVLKDASATAIYGSRGSNGVILVSTKKGSGKAKIDVDFFTTISTVPELLPVLGAADFARLENARRTRVGSAEVFTSAEIQALQQNGGSNAQDELFQTGVSNTAQLSISGAEGKTRYFISGNYTDQEGVIVNTGYERYSIRANLSTEINEKLKIDLRLDANRASTLNDLSILNRYEGTLITKALTWDPTTPLRQENGLYNRFSLKGLATLNLNPIENINTTKIDQIKDRLNTNLTISYDILENLNYTLVAGASTFNGTSEEYKTDHPLNDVKYAASKNTTHQVSNILNWQKTFNDKHDVKLTGVYEFSGIESRYNSYNGQDVIIPNGFYLGEFASGQTLENNFSKSAIESLMARAEYILSDAFFLTGTIRRDASSKFRKDNRVGYFPSVSAAYSFNNTSLVQNSNFLSNFKFRAGWGQVGNENIKPYTTFPNVKTDSRYAFDGSAVSPGSAPDKYGNPDLTWETTTQTNLGVDLGLFGGRANFSVDVYKKNTTDLLLDVPIPDTNGGGTITKNVGEVENSGIDLSLSGDIIRTDDFNWNSALTFSYSKNKVVDLGGDEEIQGTFVSVDGQNRRWNVIQLGQPLGQFNGSTFLGTWKSTDNIPLNDVGNPIAAPGDAKYLRDADGNRVIGAIGNGTPTTFWGFNNTLTYKNWDLNIFFQGVHDFDVLNAVQGIIVGNTGNQRSFLAPEQVNQWTPTNETDIPAGGLNDAGSTRYVEKGDFIRLSNLSLGYTIKDLTEGIRYLKVYASGQNLLLITDYSGYDPEHTSKPADDENAGNVDIAAGINTGAYPNPRTVSLGLKIGF